MDDFQRLEILSLVNAIAQELLNHVGISDKDLAEFLIDQHIHSKDLDEFRQKLKDAGAELPDSFVTNMDRLVLRMHPKFKSKRPLGEAANGATGKAAASLAVLDEEKERQRRLFPGLSLPDQEANPLVPEPKDSAKKDIGNEVEGMMAELDGLRKRAKRDERDDSGSPKRLRRDRDDSRSPPPHRRRSPDRRHEGGRGGRYGEDRGGGRYDNGRRAPMDETPILFKIYDGRVTGMKDFGAFVTLEGILGKAEGESIFHLLFDSIARS